MKSLFKLSLLALILTVSSCNDEYPDLEDGLYAEINTNKGTMIAELFYEKVPVTVANFVALAEGNHPMASEEYKDRKFYNGLIFHRVMDQFMIQGGDPLGTGSGTPGYRFTADFHPDLEHDKPGILSMANSGGLNTNGSQFFITEVPYPSLNAYDEEGNMKNCDAPRVSCHSVFGELVKGIEVQDSISNVKTLPGNRPADSVIINEIKIIRKGSGAKKFDAPSVFETELPKVEQRFEQEKQAQIEKMEEEKRQRDEKNAEAAKDVAPKLDDYESKSKELASGLKIHYINKGDGKKPAEGGQATVYYQGYFEDGRLFDSNVREVEERHGMLNPMKEQRMGYEPMPVTITPNAQMIPGFKEALALLREGDKAFFYVPSYLAYGDKPYGPNGEIPANSDLMFIIEMVEAK